MAMQTMMGIRGSNGTAGKFVTGVTRTNGDGTQTKREGGDWAVYSLTRGAPWPKPGEGVKYKYANDFYARDSERAVTRSGDIRQ